MAVVPDPSYLIEVRGLKSNNYDMYFNATPVVSYRGTWVEICINGVVNLQVRSYLIEVRGLKSSRCHRSLSIRSLSRIL